MEAIEMRKLLGCLGITLCLLSGSVLARSESQVSTLLSVSTRYSTIQLESGSYRVKRILLKHAKEKLMPGVRVRFGLEFSNEQFPNGLISTLEVLTSGSMCSPLCR